MTNNKTKTAIETIRGFVYDDEPFEDDSLKAILELDARLTALETSAKASEPNDESTSVEHCMISKEELQASINHSNPATYISTLVEQRVMHAIRHLIGKININDDLVIKLELVKK